ncbi:succinate dehydrogenase subunit 5, mitochondrial-like [Iris pallida]|uniref:Succinate dehydrogenase subunit 5, mitochondrial-like n=1 Tax=Iris pallida TaxID=29817 RepID=A0AAX6E207_IRIPA|nr:succinate dehydrogenase subunit 5, mitochondrial-like [Iris pallida]
MGPVLRSLSSSARWSLRSLQSASFSSASLHRSPPPVLPFAAPAVHRIAGSDCSLPLMLSLRRTFSVNTSQLPYITDPDIESAFKDLMAMSWDEIPDSMVNTTKKTLSKSSEDKVGQEALANIFRAAEASVEFGGVLISLRMVLDDLSGVTGENVARLPEYLEDAMKAAYNRYMTYLDSFGPDEAYLRKKVETELGTKMIHLKMRCSGIGSEWGKVTLLGTSGISGSYVEHRA